MRAFGKSNQRCTFRMIHVPDPIGKDSRCVDDTSCADREFLIVPNIAHHGSGNFSSLFQEVPNRRVVQRYSAVTHAVFECFDGPTSIADFCVVIKASAPESIGRNSPSPRKSFLSVQKSMKAIVRETGKKLIQHHSHSEQCNGLAAVFID